VWEWIAHCNVFHLGYVYPTVICVTVGRKLFHSIPYVIPPNINHALSRGLDWGAANLHVLLRIILPFPRFPFSWFIMLLTLDALPVELIADIMAELDLPSLITMSQISRLFRAIVSDSSLNPWRRPILHCIRSGDLSDSFKHLSVRSIVPRHNWIEIMSLAKPQFLLYEATLPNLKEDEWEECFRRRFLPGWIKWSVTRWKERFMKFVYTTSQLHTISHTFILCRTLHRVAHRSTTSCTAEESWTTFSPSLAAASQMLINTEDTLLSIGVALPTCSKLLLEASHHWPCSMKWS
jgi:hypothetical protein